MCLTGLDGVTVTLWDDICTSTRTGYGAFARISAREKELRALPLPFKELLRGDRGAVLDRARCQADLRVNRPCYGSGSRVGYKHAIWVPTTANCCPEW